MGRYALHPLNHDPLIWFCISPWWANIPEIKISCGAHIKNSLLTWEKGMPVLPLCSSKRRQSSCMHCISGQTHLQAKTVFATLPEDLKTNSSSLCRNIEEFPYKLWFCPRSCSLSSEVDNIHKCLPSFIIHFHHRNLRIFPLRCLQQQLVVLMPE